jgi:hypothetical protein
MEKNNKISALKAKAKTATTNTKRRQIITAFYDIIRSGAELKVFNESLQRDICITGKSVRETRTHASRAKTSTTAVFELLDILKNAKKVSEEAIKSNSKSQQGYKKMIILSDNIKGIGEVKLTVGVEKFDDRHIQYCLTALE